MRKLLLLTLAACMWGQKAPAVKDLKYPPLGQVKVPEPTQFTLSNGMRVYLLEDHELPLISGSALVRTGNLFDPSDKRGLADFTAAVLRSGGTKSKSGDQWDEDLENIAASVESSMGESSASVGFSGLKESTAAVLAAFKEFLTEPEFRQDRLDLAIAQTRSGIARRNDDADGIPDRELASILYGRDNSYGWQLEYEHLNNIKRDDLIAFYQRYYFPKNIILSVYGDFDTPSMRTQLEALFGGWKIEKPAVPAFPPVTAKPSAGVYLGEKADVTQTFFAIGHLGGTNKDPDYPALQVAANILGQGFSSRLVSEVRTKLGYAYNIAAVWAPNFDHEGTFRIVGSTKSASTVETVEAIRKELDKIRSTEVTEQELKEAKDGALNRFVFNFASPSQTLGRLIAYDYYGYPKDFLQQYSKAIAAVTRADVLKAAKAHFLPENLAIVAVGNPKEFGRPLTSLGKVTTLDLAIPEPKQAVAAATADSSNRATQLMDKARAAMGGAAKLAAIKDTTMTAEMQMAPQAGGVKLQQTSLFVAPNSFRQEQSLPFGKVVVYTDGKSGWIQAPQGQVPMTPEILKQAQGTIFRQLPSLIASGNANAIGDQSVQIVSGELSVTIDFDATTGLPSRLKYQEAGQAVEEILSDWRETRGVKLPFKRGLEQSGTHISDVVVSEYKVNSGLKQEDLEKRP